ncbi:MAG: formyl transferase [Chloroflexota bacterium]|nr:MAG: formyl transferase [Chloroflexota bacterium]
MNLIFFGMTGILSLAPLEGLLAGGVEIAAVIIPTEQTTTPFPRRVEPLLRPPTDLPLLNPYLSRNIVHAAWEHNVPVWEVGHLSNSSTLALLADLSPDLIAVACFPSIFPTALLQLPRYGCLNLHPSLLPAYRGPTPLFWMARQGERQAGETLHFMDEGADSGDIVAQTAFPWPEGSSRPELEQRCAWAGGQLLLAAVKQLAQTVQIARRPQPKEGSSYFSWPRDEDLLIPTTWEARRAFNFLRAAAADWPLIVAVGEQRFPASRALGYGSDEVLGQPYRYEGNELWIQFQPGVLRIR